MNDLSFYSYSGLFGMPKQKLSNSDKDDIWKRRCVDGIIGMSGQLAYNGRSTQYHKQVNYDLVNGIFDPDDMKYVTDPYGVGEKYGNQPANMVCYPIIPAKLNLLDGEELKRPFNFRAICTGGEGSNARNQKKMDMLMNFYKQRLYKEMGITPQQMQDPNFQTPQEIIKWVDQKYEDVREQLANAILRYLQFEQDLATKFNKGFKHAKICAEEVYYVGKTGGKPHVRVVNPLYFDFDRNPELESIEDSQWAREERYLSIGQIIDEFAEFLSDEQIDDLESGNFGFGGYNNQQAIAAATMTYVPFEPGSKTKTAYGHQVGIPVTTVVWRSLTKIGFVTYKDEMGEEQTSMVNDEFKLSPELKAAGATLEWEWKTEVWKGTRIGRDIYIDIAPLPNQVDDKLPYVGSIYNNLNSIATSLVDYMKPHQYLYNIVWYRLELELAKAKGKKFIMDMAQLPKSQGWSTEKWMYYFDNLGVAWINSLEEGSEGIGNNVAKFNQFNAVDMTLSQSVQQYLGILSKLEDMVGELVGVTRQREGQVSSQETVGGTERSIVQSSLITEPLFIKHNQVKQRVITHMLEVAKLCYMDGGKIEFLDDEFLRTVIEIDGDLLNDSDYGIFVTDAQTEQAVFDKLQGVAQQALQAQAITMSELITVFKSKSLSEVENVIKQGEQRREQQAQQQSQTDQQTQQQMQQMKDAAQDKQNAWQADQNDKDRETRIEEKTIQALGFAGKGDESSGGVGDAIIAQEELALKRQQQEHQQFMERTKSNDDAVGKARKDQLDSRKLNLEEAKMGQQQEQFNREQAQQDKTHMQEDKKHAQDILMKNKELEMKNKEMSMQEKEHKHKEKEHTYKLKESDAKLKQIKAQAAKKISDAKKKKK
jgi:hypothetical protein